MLYKQYIYNQNRAQSKSERLWYLVTTYNTVKNNNNNKIEPYLFSSMPHQNCNDFPDSAIILFYLNLHSVSMNHRDH